MADVACGSYWSQRRAQDVQGTVKKMVWYGMVWYGTRMERRGILHFRRGADDWREYFTLCCLNLGCHTTRVRACMQKILNAAQDLIFSKVSIIRIGEMNACFEYAEEILKEKLFRRLLE